MPCPPLYKRATADPTLTGGGGVALPFRRMNVETQGDDDDDDHDDIDDDDDDGIIDIDEINPRRRNDTPDQENAI